MSSSPAPSHTPQPTSLQSRVHRRHLVVLATAQILSGLGNGAGLALGALLAAELSGSEALGGTVSVAISLGGMLAAIPLARLAVSKGRRPALAAGYLIGLLGAVGMIAAAAIGSYTLLLLSGAALGVAAATNLQARFAATDGSLPGRRARDLSLVVWALTIGAVLGPSLAGPGATLAASLGLPVNAGAFLFSAAGLLLSVVTILAGLRPDPLSNGGSGARAAKPSLWDGLGALKASPGAGVGVLAVAAGHACMVAVMSMTTIHLQHVHHGSGESAQNILALIGLTLSGHIGGMYAFSPLVGWAVDRWGHRAMLLLAQAVFGTSALLCIVAPNHQPVVSIALFMLGVAWSLSSIAGSAVVTETVPQERRIAAQGVTDSAMSAGGVVAGLASGALLSLLGYVGLNTASLAVAAVMTLLVLTKLPRPRR